MPNNLNTSIQAMKFDTRMVDYNLKQGVINQNEYNQHLSQLPDTTRNSCPLELPSLITNKEKQQDEEEEEASQQSDPRTSC